MKIENRLVFIGGLHRSGTSLLHRCIRSHPQVSGFVDTGVPKDEGQHLQDVYEPAETYGGPGLFGFREESSLDESSSLVKEENAKRLLSCWRPHWDLDKEVLVEKSPPNLLRTRFLQALFPCARFIIMMRHPIPVSLATQKWSGTRLHSLIAHWLQCHETFWDDKDHLDRLLVLRYEKFVQSPCKVLKKVWRFIDVAPHRTPVTVKKGLNKKYFEKWKKTENRSLRRKLYTLCLKVTYQRKLKKFDYTLGM
jgi:hypothetical protein